MVTETSIRKFMFNNWSHHLDSAGCLNMTELAEHAAGALGDDDDGDIPERYFELALIVQNTLSREGLINR